MFHFPVEEQHFIDIGDEAGGDDDDEGGIEKGAAVAIGFPGEPCPYIQQECGQEAGINDVDEKQGDDYFIVLFVGPGVSLAYKVHEPDITLPNQQGNQDEVSITSQQFGEAVETIGNQTGKIGDEQAQNGDAYQLDRPVV
jgi:hypothetical protein